MRRRFPEEDTPCNSVHVALLEADASMATSSCEIVPCYREKNTLERIDENPFSNGMDFLPAATDFVFRFDVDFYQRRACDESQLHVYLSQRPLTKTDSIFSAPTLESFPVLFAARGTASNFGIYPPTLPTESAKPLEEPFISVRGPDKKGTMWIAHGDGRLLGWMSAQNRCFSGITHHEVFNSSGTLRFAFNVALRDQGLKWTDIISTAGNASAGFFRRVWRRSEVGEHPPRKESLLSASFHSSIELDERLLLLGVTAAVAFGNAERDFRFVSSWRRLKERLRKTRAAFEHNALQPELA